MRAGKRKIRGVHSSKASTPPLRAVSTFALKAFKFVMKAAAAMRHRAVSTGSRSWAKAMQASVAACIAFSRRSRSLATHRKAWPFSPKDRAAPLASAASTTPSEWIFCNNSTALAMRASASFLISARICRITSSMMCKTEERVFMAWVVSARIFVSMLAKASGGGTAIRAVSMADKKCSRFI